MAQFNRDRMNVESANTMSLYYWALWLTNTILAIIFVFMGEWTGAAVLLAGVNIAAVLRANALIKAR